MGMAVLLARPTPHRNGGMLATKCLAPVHGNRGKGRRFLRQRNQPIRREPMGKGILLWLLGIPIPLIILFLLFWH
jgi:hypothetical protein